MRCHNGLRKHSFVSSVCVCFICVLFSVPRYLCFYAVLFPFEAKQYP